ncbi:hypothetical protein SNEBB_002946 [Seison nebaliae]|nr:hypothetical protein SNEBB_002946 [Seison nebaliae]
MLKTDEQDDERDNEHNVYLYEKPYTQRELTMECDTGETRQIICNTPLESNAAYETYVNFRSLHRFDRYVRIQKFMLDAVGHNDMLGRLRSEIVAPSQYDDHCRYVEQLQKLLVKFDGHDKILKLQWTYYPKTVREFTKQIERLAKCDFTKIFENVSDGINRTNTLEEIMNSPTYKLFFNFFHMYFTHFPAFIQVTSREK